MFAVLRHNPQFRKLWYAQIVSQAGDWLNRLAVLTLIAELGDPSAALKVGGLFSLELALRLAPAGLFGPFAGPAADRLPRRLVMVVTDLLCAAVVLCMLLIRSTDDLPLLYGLLLAQSSLAIFFHTARSGALPSTVRDGDLHAAIALSSATWSVMLALGTSLGGLLMLVVSLSGIFWIDAGTYLLSAALLWRLRLPPVGEHPQPFRWRDAALLTEIRRGLQHARKIGIAPVLFAKSFWGGGGGFLVMIPILGTTRFADLGGEATSTATELGRAGFATGMLYAARGVGTAFGPILGRYFFGSTDRRLLQLVSGGFVIAAIGYSLLPLCHDLWLACACVVFAHLGGSSIWVCSATHWQKHVYSEFRGRVYALELLGMTLAFSLGGFLAGAFYDSTNDPNLVLWSLSTLVLFCGVIWTWTARKVVRED